MSLVDAYRTDVVTAVSFFRPVLAKLNLRDREKQEPVYLAEFDHLDILQLNNVVVTVLIADLKKSGGLFFCRRTNTNTLTYCYIVINASLYKETNLQKVKVAGVHEFCHFMAIIYTLTATTIEHQRDILLKRLSKKVDDLGLDSLNRFYEALGNTCRAESDVPEYDDEHFRLGCEGKTVDYDVLFKYLLFSKELFEEFFTKEKQTDFRIFMEKTDDDSTKKALELYITAKDAAAKAKDIPERLAFHQSLIWVKDYLK